MNYNPVQDAESLLAAKAQERSLVDVALVGLS